MKKKTDIKKIRISTHLIIGLILIAAGCALACAARDITARLSLTAAVLAVGVVSLAALIIRRIKYFRTASEIFKSNPEKLEKYVHTSSIPTAITDKNDRIIWENPTFFTLTGVYGGNVYMSDIFDKIKRPDSQGIVTINGVKYYTEITPCEYKNNGYTLFRFLDTANSYESKDLYKIVLATIAHLQIDNLDDIRRSVEPSMHPEIDAEITRLIAKFASDIHGIYLRYDKDKYILYFERRYLKRIIQNKFDLISEIKKVNTGVKSVYPTMSMGIGAAPTPGESNLFALRALEMALGRGGDQAVLLDNDEFKFFGGVQQGRERRTRVKVRSFSHALKNLMEQASKVIIMGHKGTDLDCLGSALGLYACARNARVHASIVMDDNINSSLQPIMRELYSSDEYRGVIISPQDALNIIDDKTMLIVTDTQQRSYTMSPELLNKTGTIIVIDHHLRGTDYIDNAALMLHEPYASSACEIVTEITEYFSDTSVLQSLEAEALLGGIMIDTKGFTFKTSARTFDAAAYLRRMGADTLHIHQLFRDDLKTFIERAHVVESARVDDGIAVAMCPPDIKSPQLLAAQSADMLLNIRGINASFVLCRNGDEVLISGRSAGVINVQRILEKLGGGGHATIAGAQIKSNNIDAVYERLKNAIKEYLKEEDSQ